MRGRVLHTVCKYIMTLCIRNFISQYFFHHLTLMKNGSITRLRLIMGVMVGLILFFDCLSRLMGSNHHSSPWVPFQDCIPKIFSFLAYDLHYIEYLLVHQEPLSIHNEQKLMGIIHQSLFQSSSHITRRFNFFCKRAFVISIHFTFGWIESG